MALYKNCNEIWPPYHALQNQPRCNSLTSLPWHYQTQAFVLASVSSICGPSAWNVLFPDFPWSSPSCYSGLSSNISSEKPTLITMAKAAPLQLPYIPLSCFIFFSWHFCYRQLFYSPRHEKNKDPEDRDFVLFTPSLETFLTHSRYSQISTGEVTS